MVETGFEKAKEEPTHPTAEVIEAYLSSAADGQLNEAEQQIRAHIGSCEHCKQLAIDIQKRLWGDVAKNFKGFE
jgi:anti-sigma factor RsiW